MVFVQNELNWAETEKNEMAMQIRLVSSSSSSSEAAAATVPFKGCL